MKRAAIRIMCLLGLLCAGSLPAADELYRREAEDKQSRIKELIRSSETGINFYGKVVDQHGQPVAGAQVRMDIRHYSALPPFFLAVRSVNVKTRDGGDFAVEGETGLDLIVDGVIKDGYEYVREENIGDVFNYDGQGGKKVFSPDRQVPIQFRLRKKGKSTLLLKDEKRFGFEPSKKVTMLHDFVKQAKADMQQSQGQGRGKDGYIYDIEISGEYSPSRNSYIVVFRGHGDNDGLMISDSVVYDAPESGYQREVVLSIPQKIHDLRKYVAVRSRQPGIYSRLDVRINAREDACVIRYVASTNPYGGKSLENEPNIPGALLIRLEKEAKKALLAGRLPEEPDLQELLRQNPKK